MVSRSIIFICILLMLMALTISCSGSDPVTGDTGVPEVSADRTVQEYDLNHYLWNYHLIYVNLRENEFEVIPVRQVADHWNILGFLEQGPCTDCLKITQIQPSGNGTLLVDIGITHPFDNANLTGFDVRGIAMFSGSHFFPESGLNMSDRWLGDGVLVNPDGYTTLYNVTTTGSGPGGLQGYIEGELATVSAPDALLNGYRRFISAGSENTRNAFYSGDAITVTYEIDMPDGPFAFGYAVDACWAPPVNQPVVDPMTDFGPEANCPEAWKMVVTSTYAGDGLTASGGSAILTIDVFDWQGKEDVHPVVVECPELFDGEVEGIWVSDGDGYTRYEAEIENVKLGQSGFYTCLVSKEAQENDPVGKPWLNLTAYQVFNIAVGWAADYPIDVTPPWLNFDPIDICMEGNNAYIAGGDKGLNIFGITDLENPVWVSWVDTDWETNKVTASGNYVYAVSSLAVPGNPWKLVIIDTDPPESAHIINTLDLNGSVSDLVISDGYACVGCRHQSGPEFMVIDIDPPESAHLVYSTTDLPFNSSADVAASDGYAYVITASGVNIYDINPAESAHFVNTVESEYVDEVVASGGYICTTNYNLGSQIIDVDPPESAHIVNSVYTPGTTREIAASGGYVYVRSSSQIHIVDVYPPESAYHVRSVDLIGADATSIAASGGYVYVGREFAGLQIIDVDPPDSAYTASQLIKIRDTHGVALSEGYAYVADTYGLRILDINTPESAVIYVSVDTSYVPRAVAISSGYACFAISLEGIHLIDIDPPESAYVIKAVDTPGMAPGVAMSGDYAYVADNEYGLQIIDISPPESAYIVKAVDTPGIARGVRLSGAYAYVADSAYGLQIIDISSPESAFILKSVYMPGSTSRVTVSGDYAYIAYHYNENSGFHVIDINPPGQAYVVKSVPTYGEIAEIAISGGFAYVACGSVLQIIDIDPLALTYTIDSIEMPDDTEGVAVSENYAYVADGPEGLRIIQLW